MLVKVVGAYALFLSCLLGVKIIRNGIWLFRVRPDPKGRVNHNAAMTIKISDLPFGKRVSRVKQSEVHQIGSEIVMKNERISEALEMPKFHLVGRSFDVSNLMPLIERKFAVTAAIFEKVEEPVEDSHVCNLISTNEILGTVDTQIAIMGRFDGSRFDPKTVYIYHDTTVKEVFDSCIKSIALCSILFPIMSYVSYVCLR